MSSQSESESVDRDSAASNDGSQLDTAGQAILKLLHKAAGVAEANSRHALETAQNLSRQLREAENRIAELEGESQVYRQKAEHAEQWLHKISTEIEERLIWKRKRNDAECRGDSSSGLLSFQSMAEEERTQPDGGRPATLHNGAVSTDFPTLRDAIIAWNRLRPEQAQRASIRIIGGQLYAAAEIPKLLNGPRLQGG